MSKRRTQYLVATLVGLVVMMAVVLGLTLFSGDNKPTESSVNPLIPSGSLAPLPVTDKVWSATLSVHIALDPLTQANQPADVAIVDGKMYVADTNDGRLLEVGPDGTSFRILDKSVDPQLVLSGPMAIASSNGQLYVADSGAGRVLIVTPEGKVSKVIALAKGDPADTKEPRPIGIAVWNDGSFAVSDANNQRLLKYDASGNLLWAVGSGKADTGENGFNTPSGLALDTGGNVYVVDILNSQVKKYSADGKFISAFGEAGDSAGKFARAKAVAVDEAGNVFVSDGLLVAVQVFDQTGKFLGYLGRVDPADPNSLSLFQAPHGLKIVDGKLYVVDRYNGIFVFDLAASGPAGTSLTTTST